MHWPFVIQRQVQSKKILLMLQILPQQYLEGVIPVILQVAGVLTAVPWRIPERRLWGQHKRGESN